jgi:hypothetical protein
MTKPDVLIGRIALRVEGENWNAYWAMPDTMEDAIFLASIAMGFVAERKDRRDAFMTLIRECVSDLLEERLGHRPADFKTEPAPEHERTKE